MPKRTPSLAQDLDYTQLQLTAEEGFVLSRIDGRTSVQELTQLTGLGEDKVDIILNKLLDQGALQPMPGAQEAPLHPAPVVFDDPEERPIQSEVEIDGESVEASGDSSENVRDNDDSEISDDDGIEDETYDAEALVRDRNYRKLFETTLHALPTDQRVDLARQGHGAELAALCFDPEPEVVLAVLANDEVGLQHARLIAAHHYNPAGLTNLANDRRFLRDRQVQRFLLRNNHTNEAVMRRILQARPLLAAYRTVTSRELTDRAKRCALQALRHSFSQASSEERVALIFKSEGRCLMRLQGAALDGKTTAMLCSRSFTSTLLIQNLLRWPATPPPVLARIASQPTVKRNRALQQQVLRHPNCPAKLKRGD